MKKYRIATLIAVTVMIFSVRGILPVSAQEFTVGLTPGLTFNDSTEVIKKPKPVERCHLIGVNYSVGFGGLYVTTSTSIQREFSPFGVGITYTYLQDLWGTMSYFGLQTGLRYSKEGFSYENSRLEPYNTTFYEVAELPFTSLFHFEILDGYVRLLVNGGLYVGYRMKVDRPYMETDDFAATDREDTDIRFDYGIRAGGGFAIVLPPVEIHIECTYKHSFSPIYQPSRDSEYYYTYEYPNQILISVGVHFQLGRKFFLKDN